MNSLLCHGHQGSAKVLCITTYHDHHPCIEFLARPHSARPETSWHKVLKMLQGYSFCASIVHFSLVRFDVICVGVAVAMRHRHRRRRDGKTSSAIHPMVTLKVDVEEVSWHQQEGRC